MAAPLNHGANVNQQGLMSNNPLVNDVESEEEEEDGGAEEILEESPCGRYHKRKERVTQRDVPGIDAAFLAMDTDYAVQVVWNEVVFSQRKSSFKPQAASIKQVFDNLMLIDHPNIIKVHKYWTTENKDEKPRLIFITEYMPSRNMKQFLKTTRSQTQKQMGFKVWKRWCIQMLSALSYLHSVEPPIIHGNLNCETLFIQHNGLLKIGSIAPDAIHTHVKTCKEQQKHFHFIAPEYAGSGDHPINEAVDIYAFGMCALEMAIHGLTGNGEIVTITEEVIEKTLNSLHSDQAEFIRSCIAENPKNRPSARELLFSPLIFEVHQLKLLSAHVVSNHDLQLQDNVLYKNKRPPNEVFATIKCAPDNGSSLSYVYGKLPQNDLEKLLEDVSQGLFPLYNYAVKKRLEKLSRVSSPEENDSAIAGDSSGEAAPDPESRMIVSITCDVQFSKGDNPAEPGANNNIDNNNTPAVTDNIASNQSFDISLKLKLDDNTTRYLNSQFLAAELSILSQELVEHGFINEQDREKVHESIKKAHGKTMSASLNAV